MRTAVPLITVLLALAVLVAAPSRSAVTVPAAAPGPHPADRLAAPLQGDDMMRRAGGVLWWVGNRCRLHRVTMRTLATAQAPEGVCQAWPAPDGEVLLAQGRASLGRAPLVALSGFSLRETQQTPVIGQVGRVSWTADSRYAAVCANHRGDGTRVELLSAPFARSKTVGYRCTSAFTQASTTLTSDGRTIFDQGHALALRGTLDTAVGRPRHGYTVTALAATPTGVAAAVAPKNPADLKARFAIVVLNRETGHSTVLNTSGPSFDLAVAPDQSALWYAVGRNREFLETLRPDGVPVGVPPIAASYAWSPDGRYLAVALRDRVTVFDRRTGATGSLPAVDPRSLTWTR